MKLFFLIFFISFFVTDLAQASNDGAPIPLKNESLVVDETVRRSIVGGLIKDVIFFPPQKWLDCGCIEVQNAVWSGTHYLYSYTLKGNPLVSLLQIRVFRGTSFSDSFVSMGLAPMQWGEVFERQIAYDGIFKEVLYKNREYKVEIVYPTQDNHTQNDPRFEKMRLSVDEIKAAVIVKDFPREQWPEWKR